jgi:hypothetical protein
MSVFRSSEHKTLFKNSKSKLKKQNPLAVYVFSWAYPMVLLSCRCNLAGGCLRNSAKKLKFFDGLGLKIALLYFLAMSVMALKTFKCCRQWQKKIFSAVGDSA